MFPSARRIQTGFTLPVAVFILVVMALVGAAMVRLAATGATSVAYGTLSTRALFAAESGAQFGMQRLFPLDDSLPGCFAATTLSFTVQGLAGCSARVACTALGAFNGKAHYRIDSTGQCGSGQDQAERTLAVGARQP